MRTEYDEPDIRRVMQQLASQVAAGFEKDMPLGIVGLRTRGEFVADRQAAYFLVLPLVPAFFKAACAAARRAMGTRNGEQLT